MLLHSLKKYIPASMLSLYHWTLARAAVAWYRDPSRALIVIGVTGTKGKSSTVAMLHRLLRAAGYGVGYTGTAGFAVNDATFANRLKMTMPGRLFLQRMLRRMAAAGCRFAIVETTSQGLLQYRHLGINYDVAVFTNLSPEHIEAHGGYNNYRGAKALLFAHLMAKPHKTIDGKRVEKIAVVNADDAEAEFFGAYPADRHVAFGWGEERGKRKEESIRATAVQRDQQGLHMTIDGVQFDVPLLANFEQQNALCAIAVARALGVPLADLAKAAATLQSVPGRFERVDAGQPFTVIVDYAYEPRSLGMLFDAVDALKARDATPAHRRGRVIGVHGSAGGGRDVARREAIGRLAGEREDVVIVTNEDPYDDDPAEIIRMVADGARAAGKRDDIDLLTFADRQDAIDCAVAMAEPGDVVLITGKGSEPVMAVAGGKKIPWDDREAARNALAKRFPL